MKILSELLLDLYRLAQGAPPDAFQRLAMERMQAVLAFDSAVWATGVVFPGVGVTAHTQFLYRQPAEMMENWARINKNDELAFDAFRQPGVTLNTALCGEEWRPRLTAETRAHLERYGMAHALTTIVAEPVPWHGRPYSAGVTLPPLAMLMFLADGT